MSGGAGTQQTNFVHASMHGMLIANERRTSPSAFSHVKPKQVKIVEVEVVVTVVEVVMDVYRSSGGGSDTNVTRCGAPAFCRFAFTSFVMASCCSVIA